MKSYVLLSWLCGALDPVIRESVLQKKCLEKVVESKGFAAWVAGVEQLLDGMADETDQGTIVLIDLLISFLQCEACREEMCLGAGGRCHGNDPEVWW